MIKLFCLQARQSVYSYHNNPLLNSNVKDVIFSKTTTIKGFQNTGVKNLQTTGYNGTEKGRFN